MPRSDPAARCPPCCPGPSRIVSCFGRQHEGAPLSDRPWLNRTAAHTKPVVSRNRRLTATLALQEVHRTEAVASLKYRPKAIKLLALNAAARTEPELSRKRRLTASLALDAAAPTEAVVSRKYWPMTAFLAPNAAARTEPVVSRKRRLAALLALEDLLLLQGSDATGLMLLDLVCLL